MSAAIDLDRFAANFDASARAGIIARDPGAMPEGWSAGFAYLRISKDVEGREAGVERQWSDVCQTAERHNVWIVGVYADNDRGASEDSRKPRPEYERMLADLARGDGHAVVAWTSSRLTRRPAEAEQQVRLARRLGVRYLFSKSPVTDLETSAGRRVARILAACDAGEADDTAERVRAAKMKAVERGIPRGGPRPFGYEPGGRKIREDEAAAIRDAVARLLAGGSLNAIARDWTAQFGITRWNRARVLAAVRRDPATIESDAERRLMADAAARITDGESVMTIGREWIARRLRVPGAAWAVISVRDLLANPRLAALNYHHGQFIGAAKWDAIITEDEHRAVVAVLADPARRSGIRTFEWLGSGVYWCGVPGCGALLVSGTRGPSKGRIKVYRCRKSAHLVIGADVVDRFVNEVVSALLRRHGAELMAVSDGETDTVAARHERVNTLRGQLDELADAYGAGQVTMREWLRVKTPLAAELEGLEAELARIAAGSVLAGVADAPDPVAAFSAATIDRRRAIVTDLGQVFVNPGKRGSGEPPVKRVQWVPRRD